METEYSSYRLGLTEKRARWLVMWLREKSRAGNVTTKEMAQGLGRLGFAAISLTIPGAGPMTIPAMLKVLFRWLADRLEERPSRPPSRNLGLSFFTDAKAKMAGHGWEEIVSGGICACSKLF